MRKLLTNGLVGILLYTTPVIAQSYDCEVVGYNANQKQAKTNDIELTPVCKSGNVLKSQEFVLRYNPSNSLINRDMGIEISSPKIVQLIAQHALIQDDKSFSIKADGYEVPNSFLYGAVPGDLHSFYDE